MRSSLGVPVLIAGQPFGNLYLTDKQDGAEFTEDDEEAVVLLAEFAGVAIDHARCNTSDKRRVEPRRRTERLDGTLIVGRMTSVPVP